MKTSFVKIFVAASLLILFSCNDEKKEKTNTTEEKTGVKKEEPKKTEVSIGPGGAEVKTKSGTEIKVGDSGTSIKSKDVKVDVKKD